MDRRPIEELEIYPRYGKRLARKKGLRRQLAAIVPRHTYLPLKAELRLAWLRFRTRNTQRRFADGRDLLVNLAPGECGKPGWVNVDARPRAEVNCIFDCRKRLPFPDGSVRAIFTEHFLEHLDYTEEIPTFLSECHRVLRRQGVMRIIVPDAELYLRGYCGDDWSELARIRPLGEGQRDPYVHCNYHTRMELINVVFRQGHQHRYAYDFETLAWVLKHYGFARVIHQSFGKSVDPDLCIDRPIHASESLYVEAIRD